MISQTLACFINHIGIRCISISLLAMGFDFKAHGMNKLINLNRGGTLMPECQFLGGTLSPDYFCEVVHFGRN